MGIYLCVCPGGHPIGDADTVKGQVLQWTPSQTTVSLKEGLEVSQPQGWEVIPGLSCSSDSSAVKVTENSYSSIVTSELSSQLRSTSSVVTHSDTHSEVQYRSIHLYPCTT